MNTPIQTTVESATVVKPGEGMENLPGGGGFPAFNLDELVPENLRQAAEKSLEQEEERERPKLQASKDSKDSPEEKVEASEEEGEEIDKIIKEHSPDQEDEPEPEPEKPFWKDHDIYKSIVDKLTYAGVPAAHMDKLLQEVADSKTIENGKLITGLETRVAEKDQLLQEYKDEFIRLKDIERSAFFDSMPETAESFISPMQTARSIMQNIIERESIPVPLDQLLATKNKSEYTRLLESLDIDDVAYNQLTNQWRNYKELQDQYLVASKEAKENLGAKLKLNITPERESQILKNTLQEAVATDDQMRYIEHAVVDGLDKHAPVGKLLADYQTHFKSLARALSNPQDYVTSNRWMTSLARFVLKAQHDALQSSQYGMLKADYDKKMHEMQTLVKAYVDLRGEAKGQLKSNGSRGPVVNGKHVDSDSKKDAEAFQKFLKGDLKFEDLTSLKNT